MKLVIKTSKLDFLLLKENHYKILHIAFFIYTNQSDREKRKETALWHYVLFSRKIYILVHIN